MTTPTAASGGIPSIVHRLNPMVRRLLALGMPMGPNVLMTVRGRKTGKDYTFPIATLEASGREFLFSPFGEVNWVANLRAAGEMTLHRGRRDRRMRAFELTPEVAAPYLEEGMRAVLGMPIFGSMVAGWYGIDRRSTAEDYRAAARRHPGFEIEEIA
jgi:deazaflavin-dependent oxidoreductase (nitroreductase family)